MLRQIAVSFQSFQLSSTYAFQVCSLRRAAAMAEWMYAERPVNSLLSSYEAFPGGSNPQRKECEAAINYDTPFSGYPRRSSLGAGGEDDSISTSGVYRVTGSRGLS